ncbi:hypothetical protein HO173_007881 [Letharia columbiana]|uniref:Uncharacterized protein n=1 Tax=Letharia columbiana TaxID=112416 RepID=A0A8H6FSQ3_9LECA|nr:uncharacterized protein HO173_007881 [Letharia columbiana]KAF6234051.1 hypothetical protein HO173_007881 [Letharia columbiana]
MSAPSIATKKASLSHVVVGQLGWGLGLSCTPAGVNPKIRKGTTITITRLPEPPDISLSRCLFSFLCANPRPGTSAKNVEGVEDEIQVNQLTVDVDGRNPGTFRDTDYKDSARHHRFQFLHIVCEFSIPTSFAFCRNSAKYPAIKDAFDGSLYEFADPSIIYVSVDKDRSFCNKLIMPMVNGLEPQEPVSNLDDYAYNVGQGTGTAVYLIYSLFSTSTSLKSILRSEFPSTDPYGSIDVKPEGNTSSDEHAVEFATEIASKSIGSCKGGQHCMMRYGKTRKDIKDNKLQGTAYINMSRGFEGAT